MTTWRVTQDQPDQYDFAGGGDPVLGHVIRFVTAAGNPGSVFIPEIHYNAANVRKLIEAKAPVADEVASLSTLEAGQ